MKEVEEKLKAILDESRSIYLQISESIEDDILSGVTAEEDPVPSTNQIAKFYSINPATAAKGVNILVDDGIIYKKRGIGMYVKTGAKAIIMKKRRTSFYENYVTALIREAEKLNITKDELVGMINRGDPAQ